MKDELIYNYYHYLQNNDGKKMVLSCLVCLFLLITILVMEIAKIYDVITVYASTSCLESSCNLQFYQNEIKENHYDFVKIENDKYSIQKIVYDSPLLTENNGIQQKVSIELKNYKGTDNEIKKIKLYKNKEKVRKKILNIILER